MTPPRQHPLRRSQGIVERNRKTEICKHWLQGACPFGEKCAFAHGAQELRRPSEPQRISGGDEALPATAQSTTDRLQSPTGGGRAPLPTSSSSCYYDPRCNVHHGHSSCGSSEYKIDHENTSNKARFLEGGEREKSSTAAAAAADPSFRASRSRGGKGGGGKEDGCGHGLDDALPWLDKKKREECSGGAKKKPSLLSSPLGGGHTRSPLQDLDLDMSATGSPRGESGCMFSLWREPPNTVLRKTSRLIHWAPNQGAARNVSNSMVAATAIRRGASGVVNARDSGSSGGSSTDNNCNIYHSSNANNTADDSGSGNSSISNCSGIDIGSYHDRSKTRYSASSPGALRENETWANVAKGNYRDFRGGGSPSSIITVSTDSASASPSSGGGGTSCCCYSSRGATAPANPTADHFKCERSAESLTAGGFSSFSRGSASSLPDAARAPLVAISDSASASPWDPIAYRNSLFAGSPPGALETRLTSSAFAVGAAAAAAAKESSTKASPPEHYNGYYYHGTDNSKTVTRTTMAAAVTAKTPPPRHYNIRYHSAKDTATTPLRPPTPRRSCGHYNGNEEFQEGDDTMVASMMTALSLGSCFKDDDGRGGEDPLDFAVPRTIQTPWDTTMPLSLPRPPVEDKHERKHGAGFTGFARRQPQCPSSSSLSAAAAVAAFGSNSLCTLSTQSSRSDRDNSSSSGSIKDLSMDTRFLSSGFASSTSSSPPPPSSSLDGNGCWQHSSERTASPPQDGLFQAITKAEPRVPPAFQWGMDCSLSVSNDSSDNVLRNVPGNASGWSSRTVW